MTLLPLRLALRELRGGVAGFRILIACLALGVAAIAGAVSLDDSVKAGIAANARPMLGGDLQARLNGAPATAEELAALKRAGSVSEQVEMRSMARAAGDTTPHTLIELKAVDGAYPLYGAVALDPALPLAQVLAPQGGRWGAAIDPSLLPRLKIVVGDEIKIGEAMFQVRALIRTQSDRIVTPFTAGPSVLISTAALPATNLVQTGSLVSFVYNIRTAGLQSGEQLRTRLRRAFPNAGWQLRGLKQAAQGVEGVLDNVTLFLTLVGLSALLTGGIGVANAVTAYLSRRTNTIATLKCLGASARLIFATYLIEIALISLAGICLGLVVGALVPPATIHFIAAVLPVPTKLGLYPRALAQATVFGALTAAVFGLWPLAQAREIPAATLFRGLAAPRPRGSDLAIIALLGTGLAAFTVLSAEQPRFALDFVIGAAVAMAAFYGAARGVMQLAARIGAARHGPATGRPTLRLALANLHRPGAPTMAVVLSLGLGLSVLVAIALLQSNLDARIAQGLPSDAPSMFFIDIQAHQADAFVKLVGSEPGVHKVLTAPMVRGRITRIKDIPVEEARVDPDVRWAVRGERGITWSATIPENAKIIAGRWWTPDQAGENLLSLDAAVAHGMHVGLGDTLTVAILGREITATIANLRDIRWQSGAMNFTLVYAPGALAGAPANYIATVNSDPGTEDRIEQAVVDAMPNVTVIQVREALTLLRGVLDSLGLAVRATALVALTAGALVLAGAIAAGHSRRVYEAVVLKVLGATRADVLTAFVFEFCLLGLATGVIAAVVGAAASWGVVSKLMDFPWLLNAPLALGVIAGCMAFTLLAGFSGTWRALGGKAAPLLRND